LSQKPTIKAMSMTHEYSTKQDRAQFFALARAIERRHQCQKKMTYDPKLDFERDIEELPAAEAQDRIEQITNMTPAEGEALLDSKRYEVYNEGEAESGQEIEDPPIPGGPTEDAIHLLETPASQWDDDEFAEADELENYAKRTVPQYESDEGDPLLPDEEPDVHRGEMALQTWLIDMEPEDSYP
jgi:hypothetical protein